MNNATTDYLLGQFYYKILYYNIIDFDVVRGIADVIVIASAFFINIVIGTYVFLSLLPWSRGDGYVRSSLILPEGIKTRSK